MVFVDATRYMKVQDEDLADTFDDQKENEIDAKYNTAHFDSFTIEPSTFTTQEPWYRRKSVWIPALLTLVVILGIGTFLALFYLTNLFETGPLQNKGSDVGNIVGSIDT